MANTLSKSSQGGGNSAYTFGMGASQAITFAFIFLPPEETLAQQRSLLSPWYSARNPT